MGQKCVLGMVKKIQDDLDLHCNSAKVVYSGPTMQWSGERVNPLDYAFSSQIKGSDAERVICFYPLLIAQHSTGVSALHGTTRQ